MILNPIPPSILPKQTGLKSNYFVHSPVLPVSLFFLSPYWGFLTEEKEIFQNQRRRRRKHLFSTALSADKAVIIFNSPEPRIDYQDILPTMVLSLSLSLNLYSAIILMSKFFFCSIKYLKSVKGSQAKWYELKRCIKCHCFSVFIKLSLLIIRYSD